jgi:LysM repeat protein
VYPLIAASYETYTIQENDLLWSIAQKKLGSGARYVEIKALNKLDSDTIHAGQVLKMPN